jgi:hypothetical protein
MLAKAVISQKVDDQSPHGPSHINPAQLHVPSAATERDNLSDDAQHSLDLAELNLAMLCNGHLAVSSAERHIN